MQFMIRGNNTKLLLLLPSRMIHTSNLLLLLFRMIQLYSAATPNGMKVAACLEEICDLRRLSGEPLEFEPHTVNIRTGECRLQEFKATVNPNGKIPG